MTVQFAFCNTWSHNPSVVTLETQTIACLLLVYIYCLLLISFCYHRAYGMNCIRIVYPENDCISVIQDVILKCALNSVFNFISIVYVVL